MNINENKICPLCQSTLIIVQDDKSNENSYFECPTCGLRFKTEGFEEEPVEIKQAYYVHKADT